MEEVPHYFLRVSDFESIEYFRTVTPVWIHRWLQTDVESFKCHTRSTPLSLEVICKKKFKVTWAQKSINFERNWAFPDCNSSLNTQRWLQKYAQSLKWHRRGALLFSEIIHQISRSHRPKNQEFWPKLRVSRLLLQFEFTNGYGIMHSALNHKGCKINDLAPDFSVSRRQLQFKFTDGYEIASIDFRSMEEVPYFFFRGKLPNFKVTRAGKSICISFDITRAVTGIKSLRFTLFYIEITPWFMAWRPLHMSSLHFLSWTAMQWYPLILHSLDISFSSILPHLWLESRLIVDPWTRKSISGIGMTILCLLISLFELFL